MHSGSGQSAALAGRALHAYLNLVRRTTRFKPTIPGACPTIIQLRSVTPRNTGRAISMCPAVTQTRQLLI